jgi:hypothetical protein
VERTWVEGILENRVLSKIFGSKWEDGVGGRRKLHSENLYNLYAFPVLLQ